MPRYLRPYLDSSVYIAAIAGEPGRAEVARGLLEDANKGLHPIIASTFVAAEVIKDRGQKSLLTEDEEKRIDDYFLHKYIVWVELDLLLAFDARRLARAHGFKPADAVHFASAIRGGADYFFRWDDGIKEGRIEGIVVCEPFWEGQPELSGFPQS